MFIVTNNMHVHRKLILCIFNERFASFLIISCIHTGKGGDVILEQAQQEEKTNPYNMPVGTEAPQSEAPAATTPAETPAPAAEAPAAE